METQRIVYKTRYGTRETLRKRWEGKVEKSDGCWLWTGVKNQKGYGLIGLEYTMVLAHRVSYELHYGPIPDGFHVRHTCDNPPCVRPDHLLVGTQRDNMLDMVRRGRSNRGKKHPSKTGKQTVHRGESHCFSRFTAKEANAILLDIVNGRRTPFRVSKDLGVSPETIYRLCRGETRGSETDPRLRVLATKKIEENRRNKTDKRMGNVRVLTDDVIARIESLALTGIRVEDIAEICNISRTSVSKVLNGHLDFRSS